MTSVTPHHNDVLFGRGFTINAHPGNQRLRSIIQAKKPEFLFVLKTEKRNFARGIVDEIENLDPPGRFLMEDPNFPYVGTDGLISDKVWICVEREKAVDKVMHRLREKDRPTASASPRAVIPVMQSDGIPQQKQQPLSSNEYHTFLQNNMNMQQLNGNNFLSVGMGQAWGQQNGGHQSSYSSQPTNQLVGRNVQQTYHIPNQLNVNQLAGEPMQCLNYMQQYHQIGNSFESGVAVPSPALSGAQNMGQPIHSLGPNLPYAQPPLLQPPTTTKTSSLHQEVSINNEPAGELAARETLNEEHDLNQEEHGEFYDLLGSFLGDLGDSDQNQLPMKSEEQLQELPLREWIDRSKTVDMPSYIKAALPLALKLTEVLLEVESLINPIPLASVTSENVLVRLKDRIDSQNHMTGVDTIENVTIKSCEGINPDPGGKMPRLFALGVILYEVFSQSPLEDASIVMAGCSKSLSVKRLSITDEVTGSDHISQPQQKSQRQSLNNSDDAISSCIARLESKGIPWALCTLVRNLLDCSRGDFSGDEAYSSLADLQLDLQLMLDDPSRFLDNIRTNPMPLLSISNKLYGREGETAKLEVSYQQHISGECSGIIIKGGAGVGKSRLAINALRLLTNQRNGYFLAAKFDQNKDVNPLSTVGTIFNSLCDSFSRDATPDQLKLVQGALESALGSQAGLLAGVVPSLSKLMPSCAGLQPSSSCVDSALSMRFLFAELLNVISSFSRPISLLLDDMQWADVASLLLVGNLLSVMEGCGKSIFFAFCYRDDEVSNNEPFISWLSSITMFPLEAIKLENMAVESVNRLVSDALHLSPRITRPLSSVLHRKTGGNPLFLRQLMYSLNERNHISVQLNPPRWTWDLNLITEMKISDDVVSLLLKDMQRLPTDLQLGLEVASCFGSYVKCSVLEILSKNLEVDLKDILQQVSKRGFVDNIGGGTMFRFAHDKIQQAAYELMTEQKRRANHMRLGLALAVSWGDGAENDEMLFASANQINHGGPDAVLEPSQKSTLAELNLNAGRRAIDLSDYDTAFQLFQHGISFLGNNHWAAQYDLSVDLFDAAAEAACVLNKGIAVTAYSEQLVAHAKCFDDKLHCLYVAAKALKQAELLKESMESSFAILLQAGEELPRVMGDAKLTGDIQIMMNNIFILQEATDSSILNMEVTTNNRTVTLLKLYANLAYMLHITDPSLIGAVSLRMVDITIKSGLTSISPLAFAYYGETLASIGYITEGCRLGRLALKLLEKIGATHRSSIICMVYQLVLWAKEPFQSIVDAHRLGEKAGRQAGDFLYATLNSAFFISTSFATGQRLDTVRDNIYAFIMKMRSENNLLCVSSSMLLHSQCLVLIGGVASLDADGLPSESDFPSDKNFLLGKRIHNAWRAFLLRQLDIESLDINVLDTIIEEKHTLRPLPLTGIFFEGLMCNILARQANNDERTKWMLKAESVLTRVKLWSEHSTWNWENKMLLLEAEKMHTLGIYDRAATLYESAIRSAREHKFIHEEAIASELAGVLYCDRRHHQKALTFLVHSVRCYKEWGALAVANQVETFITCKYGDDYKQQLDQKEDALLTSVFASGGNVFKKRQGRER